MRKISIPLILVTVLIAGCAGVKFAPANVNEPIPEAFTKRALYPSGVAGYEFQDLVGNVLFIKDKQDPLRIGLLRPNKYENDVIPITDPNNYYRSRIQKGADAQGAYLAFAAKFSAEEMAELTLVDIARAGIVFGDETVWKEILKKAIKWVKDNPKTDQASKRLWVKSIVLSRRVYHSHTKIKADASGQVGDVSGVKTGVYRKSEKGIKSVMLGFEAFDIDKLAKQASSKGLLEVSVDNILDSSRYVGLIDGEIKLIE